MKIKEVLAPGSAVGSDETEVYLEARYDFEPIVQFHPYEEPEGGVYLHSLYYDNPQGKRFAVPWTDEPWVDEIIDQLYASEMH